MGVSGDTHSLGSALPTSPRLPLQPRLAVPLRWPSSPETPGAEPISQERPALHPTHVPHHSFVTSADNGTGTMAQEPHTSYARVMENFVLPTVPIGAVAHDTKTRSPESLCPCGPSSLPGEPGGHGLWPGRGSRQPALPVGRALPHTPVAPLSLPRHSEGLRAGRLW